MKRKVKFKYLIVKDWISITPQIEIMWGSMYYPAILFELCMSWFVFHCKFTFFKKEQREV